MKIKLVIDGELRDIEVETMSIELDGATFNIEDSSENAGELCITTSHPNHYAGRKDYISEYGIKSELNLH